MRSKFSLVHAHVLTFRKPSHRRYAPPLLRPAAALNRPAVARTCNLIFIVLDVLKPLGDKKLIETELEGFGIRLNKKPPSILVRRKEKGGIAITNTVPLTNIDQDEIKAILSEYKINNVDIAIREPNATADDLVDVIEGNRYVLATYPLIINSFNRWTGCTFHVSTCVQRYTRVFIPY